jgi:aspartyl aminopeptidase
MSTTDIQDLAAWIDSSPTPFHVVKTASERLLSKGFTQATSFVDLPDSGFMCVDGSVIAWRKGPKGSPFRVMGAHTDSPNLRVHPRPDITNLGWSQLGVEIYGGVLLNSWLDRDLGIAGRVVDSAGRATLFAEHTPLARVPQLAIHLDREVNERGVQLDKQAHMMPVWGTTQRTFSEWLQNVSGVSDIAAFDAHLFDITPAAVLGHDASLFASARLDNQLSCWAAVNGLINSSGDHTSIVVLNDHEEVGSESATGAGGPLLEQIIASINEQDGHGVAASADRMRASYCLSADNAHAIHPNYPERHEPRHAPRINEGPAIKLNGNQRYATSSRGAAFITAVATRVGAPVQTFVTRNNMPCGSTIGPITATRLGIESVDIGVPQLSMHSARELCGVNDVSHLRAIATGFFSV